MRVTILEHGTSAEIVKRDLLGFGRNLADMSDAMDEAGDILRDAVVKQFRSEGAYGGAPWRELAESTKAQRARRLGLAVKGGALRNPAGRFASAGHPILRVTDELYNALRRKFDPRHVEDASGTSLRFGATVPYLVFHQSTAPRDRLPRRAPVVLSELDKRAVTKAIQSAAVRGVRGADGPR